MDIIETYEIDKLNTYTTHFIDKMMTQLQQFESGATRALQKYQQFGSLDKDESSNLSRVMKNCSELNLPKYIYRGETLYFNDERAISLLRWLYKKGGGSSYKIYNNFVSFSKSKKVAESFVKPNVDYTLKVIYRIKTSDFENKHVKGLNVIGCDHRDHDNYKHEKEIILRKITFKVTGVKKDYKGNYILLDVKPI